LGCNSSAILSQQPPPPLLLLPLLLLPLLPPPPPALPPALLHAVLRGMGTVFKVEQLGSSSGKPSGRAVITDSGQLPMHWRPKAAAAAAAAEPPGVPEDPYAEVQQEGEGVR
jgi:hypothetical protein